MKIDPLLIEKLEDGTVVYVHAETCGNHCEYGCNNPLGTRLADELNAGLRWHMLSCVHQGEELVELLASTSVDGIGCIARWGKRDDGGWDVSAMDTEGEGGMEPVTDFHEGEPVPRVPPLIWCDAAELERDALIVAINEAIRLIARSEETEWCTYATQARELLEKASPQSNVNDRAERPQSAPANGSDS